ncbi:MAG: nicotinamide riboside transporter PnuC [Saprospiraceae bacterium]
MKLLEPFAALLGVLGVGLIVHRSVWAYPLGIIMAALYVYIFFQARLYSDMLLQVAFVGLQIQGWYAWTHSPLQADDHRIQIRRLSPTQWAITATMLAAGTVLLGGLMHRYTNAAIPYLDAGTATLSLVAQWWTNQRYIDNWLLWIIADAVYLYQYSSQQLYFTTALYAVFLAMAFWGWKTWTKRLRSAPAQHH